MTKAHYFGQCVIILLNSLSHFVEFSFVVENCMRLVLFGFKELKEKNKETGQIK